MILLNLIIWFALAGLVHEQNHAGIVVPHNLRMVQYADRAIQMFDGCLARILDARDDLARLADSAECRMITGQELGCERSEDYQPKKQG